MQHANNCGYKYIISKYMATSAIVGYATRSLYTSSEQTDIHSAKSPNEL